MYESSAPLINRNQSVNRKYLHRGNLVKARRPQIQQKAATSMSLQLLDKNLWIFDLTLTTVNTHINERNSNDNDSSPHFDGATLRPFFRCFIWMCMCDFATARYAKSICNLRGMTGSISLDSCFLAFTQFVKQQQQRQYTLKSTLNIPVNYKLPIWEISFKNNANDWITEVYIYMKK